jgi:S-DNA-T family DNA segregation ATPase FtsK/SpoIIIE
MDAQGNQGMKVTPRTSAAVRARADKELAHRGTDIVGILVVATGIIAALSLILSNTGLLGSAIEGFMRVLFGKGAWIMPIVLVGLGYSVLAGKKHNDTGSLTWGLLLIFSAVLGVFAGTADVAGSGRDFFDPGVVSSTGGYLGAMVGWFFDLILGSARMVGLGALVCVGVVLCLRMPLRSIAEGLKRPSKTLARRVVRPLDRNEKMARAVIQSPTTPDTGLTQSPRTRTAPIIRETQQKLGGATLESIPKEGYQLPPLSLLTEPVPKPERSKEEMQQNIDTLESTLEEFGIDANVVEVATGPTVTRYEIQLGPGIRVARITALADNIAMNLAASQVRVEAPIPGKAAIGVEVPNVAPSIVALREACSNKEFLNHSSRLAIALGQDVSGVNKVTDLTRMPHLLIGGATNSGKSIGLTAIIMSLLMRNTPKDVRLVMIDPKRVELTLFDNIPHLMCPVVRDVKEAPGVLRAVWREMDRRYEVFAQEGVRNIDSWNKKASFQEKMCYIVVVIDELADLMIQAAAEVETSICRIAQLARATGIHLVIATQRPSVDVITGTIKANIASRIAYTVSSQIDSRTILDQAGAERLIGRGDMLFLPIDASKPVRVQSAYVTEAEIEAVCDFWRQQEKPCYSLKPIEAAETGKDHSGGSDDTDALWEDAVRFVVDRGQASTSMLQRRFAIGFQRASRLLDMMEERNIVGPRDGPRPREVLVDPLEVEDFFGGSRVHGPQADPEPEEEETE